MELKIFGKKLFEFNKGNELMLQAVKSLDKPESKFLPDFNNFNGGNESPWGYSDVVRLVDGGSTTTVTAPSAVEKLSAKKVYQLQMLDKKSFKLNVDPKYIDSQLEEFKDKLALIKTEEYDMRRGVEEVSSVIVRMENRKKYESVKDFFEQYPYTTSSRIDDLVKGHNYLKLGQIAQFLADLPKEATQAMKDYNAKTKEVCEKQAVFYIIADKKDFERTNKRRDPILLAQSPFAHVWQILGAWDEEMLFLEEL